MNYKEHFNKFGYCVVKNILSIEEVQQFRKEIHKHFSKVSSHYNELNPEHILNIKEINELVFHQKIISALKEVLGEDYALFFDLQVHRNTTGSWHLDCNSEMSETQGHKNCDYLWADPNYRHVKCGLVFQDNTKDWGGGINLIPGRFHFPFKRRGFHRINVPLKKIIDALVRPFKEKVIKSEAGDFLIFDSRLPHTSTKPQKKGFTPQIVRSRIINTPKEHTKFVLYWSACRNKSKDYYLENNARKALKEKSCKETPLLYTDYLSYAFPEDFPENIRNLVKENGITMATPSSDFSKMWKAKKAAHLKEV